MNDAKYIELLERVVFAAWNARKDPTEENVRKLAKALDSYDRILGWDGKLRSSLMGELDVDDA